MTLREYYLQLKPDKKRGFTADMVRESGHSEPTVAKAIQGKPVAYPTVIGLLYALHRLDPGFTYTEADKTAMCRGEVTERQPRKVRQWGKK